MNNIQKEIIEAIKKDTFLPRDFSQPQKIMLHGLYALVKNRTEDEIRNEILKLECVEMIDPMTGQIQIPAHYFE